MPRPRARASLSVVAVLAGMAVAAVSGRSGVAAAPTGKAAASAARTARVDTGSLVWTGSSGGFRWEFTPRNMMALRKEGEPPVYSAARQIRKEMDPDGFQSLECRARPLSLVGSLLTYRQDDYWTGGAHPSGNIAYRAVDAANPQRTVALTDLFDSKDILVALLADKLVTHVREREKLPPVDTAEALVKQLANQVVGGDADDSYSFPAGLLQEFAFHHVEGQKVAVRLCLPWGGEIHRFHSSEIGLLLPIPDRLREPLRKASDGSAGFLMLNGKKLFGERTATLLSYEKHRK